MDEDVDLPQTPSRWQVRRNQDGTTTWTSPQGREYTKHPPARWKVPGE
jgi:hypothetical protein